MTRKWYFSTSCGASKFFGVSRDLSEYRGSGITFLAISSLNHQFSALFPWPKRLGEGVGEGREWEKDERVCEA